MTRSSAFSALLVLPVVAMLALASQACGGAVASVGDGSGGGSVDAGGGGSAGDAAATTPPPSSSGCPLTHAGVCCGDTAGGSSPTCVNGEWSCPYPTTLAPVCPAYACDGPGLSGEVCGPSGWECAPTLAAYAGCAATLCRTCPAKLSFEAAAGCQCACDAQGHFTCNPEPTFCACQADSDCSKSGGYVACVNGACMTGDPGLGGCWNDVACGAGLRCDGTQVCPCNADCSFNANPGKCVPR